MRDIVDYENKYLNNNFEIAYQVKYRRKKVIELLKKYPHENILEIGCGMESLAAFIDDFKEYTIVDPSEVFIENAKEKLKNSKKKVSFITNSIEDASAKLMETKNFDYIILSSLLHEVENPSRFLESVIPLCAENTVIHINVPNANSFHRLLGVESGYIKSIYNFSGSNILFQQHSVFDMDMLLGLIKAVSDKNSKNANFLEMGSYFVKPFTHRQMEQCMENNIINNEIIEGFDRMIKYMPDLGSEIYVNFSLMNL